MEHFKVVCVVVLFVPAVMGVLDIKPEGFLKGTEICNKLTKEPFFETEMVVGKPWRIYYSWNMKLDDKCMDMTFKNATPMIINRVWNDMNEYLETQPYWDAATLLVWMGRAKHEMLLFADQGAAGRFIGVPNVVRDGNISPTRKAVPLLSFHMKLVYEGKYLVIGDCHLGVGVMSARSNAIPYRAEIAGVASQFDLGEGFQACTKDINKDEVLGIQ